MSTDAPATSAAPSGDDDAPAHRYTAALAQEIELALAGPLGRRAARSRRRTRPARWPIPTASPARPQAVRARHVPVPVRHRPARRPPAGLHRHRRVRPLPADGRAATCCTRWASTRSGCRPSSTPCRPARTRPITTGAERRHLPPPDPPPRPEPRPRAARSTPPTRRTTAGRSGSSCRSSSRGTTPRRSARPAAIGWPARSASCAPSSTPAPAELDDGRRGRRCRPAEQADVDRRLPPGVRVRRAGQLVPGPGHGASPTRRSPPTGAATAATSRSSSATCASG